MLLTGNHQLLGPATVLQGTLALDGTFAGSVIVGEGGTFDANGAIGGPLKVKGRVSARTPVAGGFGTLAAVGPITLGRGLQLGLDVDAVGGNSLLATNSRAAMDGTLVTVNAEAGEYGRVTSYAVLHANLGLSGAATSRAAVTNVPALDADLSQSATTLFLTLLNWNMPLQPRRPQPAATGFRGGARPRESGRERRPGGRHARADRVERPATGAGARRGRGRYRRLGPRAGRGGQRLGREHRPVRDWGARPV